MKKRAVFYVDGFNLYHSIDNLKLKKLLWLSLFDLAKELVPSRDEEVHGVKYFSAVANHRTPASIQKHRIYIQALKQTGVECILGRFKKQHRKCYNCNHTWRHPEEKETDVNIAVHMVADAFQDLFDVCYLISADTDLIPPLRMVKQTLLQKEVVAVSPPGRPHGQEIKSISDRALKLNKDQLGRCRLPETISLANGTIINCPIEYS